jgi:hypothetical protein
MEAMTITTYPVDVAGWRETAGPDDEDAGDLGSLVSAASSIAGSQLGAYGGVVQSAGQLAGDLISRKPMSGRNLGGQIGKIAGGALGTYLGGSALGGAASALGEQLGGLAGGGIEQLTGKKGRPLSGKERAILDEGKRLARSGNPAAMTDAFLAVYRPQAYNALRRQGKLPGQVMVAARERLAQQKPAALPPPVASPAKPERPKPEPKPAPPARTIAATPVQPGSTIAAAAPPPNAAPPPAAPKGPDYPPLLREWAESLNAEQRARLEAGMKAGRGADAFREIQAELATQQAIEAELQRQRAAAEQAAAVSFAHPEQEAAPEAAAPDMDDRYDETATPPAPRPRPARHIGIIPMQKYQLEHLLLHVPALRKLDPRFLALMSGRSAAVRDVAGIDPATRTYHAEPGETAAGIAKKLTGRAERAVDLLAANPGHRDGDPLWIVPPGWMHFAALPETGDVDEDDTGATSRVYIVKTGDTPVGIATQSGAKAARGKWWSELKAANPQIPTKDDGAGFQYFYAGQQLWIPEEWPQSAMFQTAGQPPTPQQPKPSPGPTPPQPQPPGLPVPSMPSIPLPNTTPNTTIDAGVIGHTQSMLALWNIRNPGACNPPDYGQGVQDFTGTSTMRTMQALQSFQFWYNRSYPSTAPLRMDGVLDDPTYKSLINVTVATIPIPGTAPGPLPKPGQQPPQPQQPQQGTPPGPIPGIPAIPGLPLGGAPPPFQGVPGIHGGVPGLGGSTPFPGPNATPLGTVPMSGNAQPSPPPNGNPGNGQLFPAGYGPGDPVPWAPGSIFNEDGTVSPKIPGAHVPGKPPNVVWDWDGSMTTLPPGYVPVDSVPGKWLPYAPPGAYSPNGNPWTWPANVPANVPPIMPQQPPGPSSPPVQQPPSENKGDGGGLGVGLLAAAALAML